jgi:hypothetical protein
MVQLDTAILPYLPYFPSVAGTKGFFTNLTRSPEEIRDENLRRWVASVEGATPIAEVQPRQRAKVAGVIQNIRIDPREGSGSVEATFIDGTGSMLVRWLGRHSLSGIRLGAGLIVEGIIGQGPTKECIILNPEYDLVASPEHG